MYNAIYNRRVRVIVFNATFNNISVGSQFYWWRKPEKTINLLLVTDKSLSHNVVWSTPRLGRIRTHNVSADRY